MWRSAGKAQEPGWLREPRAPPDPREQGSCTAGEGMAWAAAEGAGPGSWDVPRIPGGGFGCLSLLPPFYSPFFFLVIIIKKITQK